MNYRDSIVPVRIGMDTVVRVPESWTCFTYRGFLYRRGEDGRFVVRGKWGESPRDLSMETERNRDSLAESTAVTVGACTHSRS